MSMSSFEEPSPRARSTQPARRVQPVFDLPAAMERLPLVRPVVRDLAEAEAARAHVALQLHKSEVENSQEWDAKKQRFALADQVTAAEKRVATVRVELKQLGLVVLDAVQGTVGFPTIVNGGLAYLVFRLEEDDVKFWCYRDEARLRAIPETWIAEAQQVPAEECEGLLV